LVNDQRDARFFSMYLSLYLTLYIFRAHCAHHQERQIVSIQPLAAVTLCRRPCRVQVGSERHFTDKFSTTDSQIESHEPNFHREGLLMGRKFPK